MAGLRRTPAARWTLAAILLVLISFGIVRAAGTRPSFDAFGWLVWGYQTLHASLDLAGAPTWKPLTWLFTTPYALTGLTGAMWLWMTTATALSLAGIAFAARATHRLATLAALPQRAALLGAATAGVALLAFQDYPHYVLSFQSDPVIVTLSLIALDCGLRDRPRLALVAITLAGLGRPEAWPFALAYGVWSAWRRPNLRVFVVLDLLVIPLLWFGVPVITNGKPLIGATTALNSPRALHSGQISGTISRFIHIQILPVGVLALAGFAWAAVRRDRRLLALGAAVAVWVLVEIAFAYKGWAALPRYMFEAAAGETVLAGVAVAALTGGLLLPGRVVRVAGSVVAGVALLTFVPYAVDHVRKERDDLVVEHHRTEALRQLRVVLQRSGGPRRINGCGRPGTSVRFVSALAYFTDNDVGLVGHHPDRELRRRHASVFFLPLGNGWSVLPWHLHGRHRRTCPSLKGSYVFPPADRAGLRRRYINASFR